jgi:hypothetical protein
MDDAAEHVTPELVGAQGVFLARGEQATAQVLLVNALRCDQIGKDRRKEQEDNKHKADHGPWALSQAPPGADSPPASCRRFASEIRDIAGVQTVDCFLPGCFLQLFHNWSSQMDAFLLAFRHAGSGSPSMPSA